MKSVRVLSKCQGLRACISWSIETVTLPHEVQTRDTPVLSIQNSFVMFGR